MAVEDKSIKSITQGYLQLQGAETEDLDHSTRLTSMPSLTSSDTTDHLEHEKHLHQ
jgi:hypothetical protein